MKPNLIIVPGWGGTRLTWQNFSNRASSDFVVHCVEMPCFGNEPCPTTVWGVEEYAEFLRAKIQTIRQVNPNVKTYLLAHSFGGQIAVKLLSEHQTLVDGLVLSGPAIYRRPWTIKNLLFLPLAKLGTILFSLPGLRKNAAIARKVLYKLAASPDYNQTSGVQRAIFKRVTGQDVSANLGQLTLPVAFVAGKLDRYVRYTDTARAAKATPNSTYTLVPDGKHGLHHTHPAILLAQLKTLIT